MIILKTHIVAGTWLLVLSGVSAGYDGLTGQSLLQTFGNTGPAVESLLNLLVGAAAIMVGYHLLTSRKAK